MTRMRQAHGHWLDGVPMDPAAGHRDPLPALPGFPFLHDGAGALIVGPTGKGRSSLVQACAYDAALQGHTVESARPQRATCVVLAFVLEIEPADLRPDDKPPAARPSAVTTSAGQDRHEKS